jgi:hypothetical protein
MPFFFFHSNGFKSFGSLIQSGKIPTPSDIDLAHEMNVCARHACAVGVKFLAAKDTCAPIYEKGLKV